MSYSYGLDAELEAKRKGKYDPAREVEAKQWIIDVIGEEFPGEDFQECLKNGQILCKLASKLTSTTVKFNTSGMPFKQMENINSFLQACDKLGIYLYAFTSNIQECLNRINSKLSTSLNKRTPAKVSIRRPP
jgi:hypothetical protein